MAAGDTLVARQGDTLDLLIWRERGLGAADIAGVLARNPGLAGLGAVLPIGAPVILPDTPPAARSVPLVNLWD
ncbi:tail protein X [Sphingomonas morindae]|uniref:Tail protein X n=1 Tax=Sphingomonas morindae TaxID=1541170 RepID=A0ABY4X739_9SPHN|nr:tail protein X [Sphingomonas morindae]USI72721.1 tail protein X [Sphingomonas morindae]